MSPFIADMPLRPQVKNSLLNAGLYTIHEVKKSNDAALLRLPNFGIVALRELRAAIAGEVGGVTIPEDIRKRGEVVALGWVEHQKEFGKNAQPLSECIAIAVLAERERCAQIAEVMDNDGRSNWGLFTARRIRAGK